MAVARGLIAFALVCSVCALFVVNHAHPLGKLITSAARSVLGEGAVSARVPVVRAAGSDCRDDAMSCGNGYYCCNNVCEPAVKATVMFAADDRGHLAICQQLGYKPVASANSFVEAGVYVGWMPCKETFLTTSNYALEGGASLVVFIGSVPYGSGSNNLPMESQTDSTGPYRPIVPFKSLNDTLPHANFLPFGAVPVKDAVNSYAAVTTFRFMPPTC